MASQRFRAGALILAIGSLLAAACGPVAAPPLASTASAMPATAVSLPTATVDYDATPLPTRQPFGAGHTLPYVTQTGDTTQAIAAHFNTTPEEVAALNPGRSLTIPAYWFPLGGSAYKIIPDSDFVFGPTTKDFDIDQYVASQPGYLRQVSAFVADKTRSGAQTVLYVAEQYSVNPRLLLALMEWRTGALTQPDAPPDVRDNPFGPIPHVTGLYGQLRYVAEAMSVGYYGWRTGQLTSLLLKDSTTSRPDMYQTAGTVAVQYLFAQLFDLDEFTAATAPGGFGATYIRLWGNPFDLPPAAQEVLPGDLTQPDLALPFPSTQTWAFTGGPHPVWGSDLPWAALDFAPGGTHGCLSTELWVTAEAPGIVVRADDNTVVLDLDGDGHEQTGWVLFHFHIAADGMIPAGTVVKVGDALGHPSCDGGVATGTHVHLARKYNGEWIAADGVLPGIVPFVLGGWTAARGEQPYQGRMMRIGAWVEACTCSTALNTVYWFK